MDQKSGYIYLDKNTNFKGELEGSYIIVEGKLIGTIRAEKEVFMKDGCHIEGEIYTKKISAETGSVFHGVLHMDGNPLEYQASAQETTNGSENTEEGKSEEGTVTDENKKMVG